MSEWVAWLALGLDRVCQVLLFRFSLPAQLRRLTIDSGESKSCVVCPSRRYDTANLQTKNLDVRGSASIGLLVVRGGFPLNELDPTKI